MVIQYIWTKLQGYDMSLLQATATTFETESIDDELHLIPKCVGVGRELWEKLAITLCNAHGIEVVEGVVFIDDCFTKFMHWW